MYIGIEIGGTKLQIGIGNPKTGEMENVFRFEVEKQKGALGILNTIEKTINGFPESPKAIGIGFGGPINRKTGLVVTSHQIDGWGGLNLREWFQDRYRVPVTIENDANTAALAEAHFGAGKGFNYQFYVTLGSGVGGGMVVNKKLYQGNLPGESEIGLLNMDRSGKTLERLCSGWALDALIRKTIKSLPSDSVLREVVGNKEGGEARFLNSALEQNDESAIHIFSDYVESLAWGLSHVVHLFNPQIIVLGGGVSLLGVKLAKEVEEALPKYLVEAYRPGPIVRISELGKNVVLVGALCLLNRNIEYGTN